MTGAAFIVQGDALRLPLPDGSVDAIVTDPPYGLEFMGKQWDSFAVDPVTKSWNTKGRSKTNAPERDPTTPGGRSAASTHFHDNPRCRKCGRTTQGRDTAKGFKVCHCDAPVVYAPSTTARNYQAWCEQWATDALRVLKPGGWLLAFGGCRTWHRLACGIEDAGFEMRDTIAEFGPLAWVYGSGFPKSRDVSKDIDKMRNDHPDWQRVGAWLKLQREAAGYTRQSIAPLLTGHKNLDSAAANMSNWENGLSFPTWERWEELRRLLAFGPDMDAEVWRLNGRKGQPGEAWHDREVTGKGTSGQTAGMQNLGPSGIRGGDYDVTAPASPEAERWQGWGTSLKPSWEPVIVARKPLSGTVAQNVLTYGTGALNIDASRIETSEVWEGNSEPWSGPNGYGAGDSDGWKGNWPKRAASHPSGRWPPNVALVHSAGCQPTGTRKIRASAGGEGGGRFNGKDYAGDAYSLEMQRTDRPTYADADGMEEITAWTCQPDCPVALLDQQSGERPSGSRAPGVRKGMGYHGANGDGGPAITGNTGGSSRFFYTAKAGPNERVTSLIPSCSCQTVKPSISLPRDTDESRSDAAESSSMSWSGNEPTVPSPSATSSTTETGTSSTTSLATSSSSPPPSTSESTAGASNAPTAGISPAGSAGSSSESTLITGTSAQRDGPSTADAGPATSPRSSQRNEPGVCAECGAPYKLDSHPTVKPLALMRWLVRLVTPPGGILLDMFAGSGTTGEAAMLEGFRSVLIDKDPTNLPSIRVRTHPYVRRTKIVTNGQAGPEQGSLPL